MAKKNRQSLLVGLAVACVRKKTFCDLANLKNQTYGLATTDTANSLHYTVTHGVGMLTKKWGLSRVVSRKIKSEGLENGRFPGQSLSNFGWPDLIVQRT